MRNADFDPTSGDIFFADPTRDINTYLSPNALIAYNRLPAMTRLAMLLLSGGCAIQLTQPAGPTESTPNLSPTVTITRTLEPTPSFTPAVSASNTPEAPKPPYSTFPTLEQLLKGPDGPEPTIITDANLKDFTPQTQADVQAVRDYLHVNGFLSVTLGLIQNGETDGNYRGAIYAVDNQSGLFIWNKNRQGQLTRLPFQKTDQPTQPTRIANERKLSQFIGWFGEHPVIRGLDPKTGQVLEYLDTDLSQMIQLANGLETPMPLGTLAATQIASPDATVIYDQTPTAPAETTYDKKALTEWLSGVTQINKDNLYQNRGPLPLGLPGKKEIDISKDPLVDYHGILLTYGIIDHHVIAFFGFAGDDGLRYFSPVDLGDINVDEPNLTLSLWHDRDDYFGGMSDEHILKPAQLLEYLPRLLGKALIFSEQVSFGENGQKITPQPTDYMGNMFVSQFPAGKALYDYAFARANDTPATPPEFINNTLDTGLQRPLPFISNFYVRNSDWSFAGTP